jgi:ABC-2 type transport system ATP-binding protein
MHASAVELDHVCRAFGRKIALDDVCLSLEEGAILGLVGRNAAGKTTMLRIALGLLHPDSGGVCVLGVDPIRRGLEVRKRVSLLSEDASLYPWMTVDEICRFAASLHPRWHVPTERTLRDRLQLPARDRVDQMSRGSRAKVALVLALSSRPELLLLDEPTAGLDPLVRREVLEGLLESLPARGGTVIYASHLLQDVERLADRVAILDGGRLVLHESADTIRLRFSRAVATFEDELPFQLNIPGAVDQSRNGRTLQIVARSPRSILKNRLYAAGAVSVALEALSLEDLLIAHLRGAADSLSSTHG